jgi:hypothetical protein
MDGSVYYRNTINKLGNSDANTCDLVGVITHTP